MIELKFKTKKDINTIIDELNQYGLIFNNPKKYENKGYINVINNTAYVKLNSNEKIIKLLLDYYFKEDV